MVYYDQVCMGMHVNIVLTTGMRSILVLLSISQADRSQ